MLFAVLRTLALAVCFTVLSSAHLAQANTEEPVKATLCELVKNPKLFTGKMVQIRANVVSRFEVNALSDGFGCQIWLEWPHGTYVTSGDGDGTEYAAIKALSDIKHEDQLDWKPLPRPRPVLLRRDRNYDKLVRCLNRDYKGSRGMRCISCPLCEASATVVGRFDHKERGMVAIRGPKGIIGVGFGGFGHLNSWPSQLVPESVSDVVTKPIDRSVYEKVRIVGSVVDGSGALIVNARVLLHQRGRNHPVGQTRTNTEGEFSFDNLNLQSFELTIEADGFRRRRVRVSPKSPGPFLVPPVKLELLGIVLDNPPAD